MRPDIGASPETTSQSQVAAMLRHMATALKNLRTYGPSSPVLRKSLEVLFAETSEVLGGDPSVTLLVGESEFTYGNTVVYSCSDRSESLAFALYKDGIRLLSFKAGLSDKEMRDFLDAIHESREADPYQSDLVTILWEKDLSNITYRAVDSYLEDKEKEEIQQLEGTCSRQSRSDHGAAAVPGPEFFVKELGLSPHEANPNQCLPARAISAADTRDVIQELLQEDEEVLLERGTEICLEVAHCADTDDLFHGAVSLLGRICARWVAAGDFLPACSILSDLHSLAAAQDLAPVRRDSITDTVVRLGDRRVIKQVAEHLDNMSKPREEEVFAYLALMAPVATEPLCEMLSESESRDIRYLLCRVISIVGRNEPDRLRNFVSDRRWYVVRNMAMIMGMMGNQDSVPLLRFASGHKDARVRKEVARSLGRISSEAGVNVLGDLLHDESASVRLAAIIALRTAQSQRGAHLLEGMIKCSDFTKRSADEKREAMMTYGSLGGGSLDLLKAIAAGEVDGKRDVQTRAAAVQGIAAVGSSCALELLESLSKAGEGPVRQAACEAMALLERARQMAGDDDPRA